MSDTGSQIIEIPLDQIETGKSQVRQKNIDKNLDVLVKSIQRFGLIEPVSVFKKNGGYELLAGQRRYRAHQKLDLSKIKAVIHAPPKDQYEAKAISLAENVTKEDMVPMDIIDACDEFYKKYGSVRMVAEQIGLTEHFVRKYVKYVRLPTIVQEHVDQGKLDMDTAIRAADAYKYDTGTGNEDKILELAASTQKLSRSQQRDITKSLQVEPGKPIKVAIEEATQPKESKQIVIEMISETYDRIDQYRKYNKLKSVESASEKLIEIGLEKSS